MSFLWTSTTDSGFPCRPGLYVYDMSSMTFSTRRFRRDI